MTYETSVFSVPKMRQLVISINTYRSTPTIESNTRFKLTRRYTINRSKKRTLRAVCKETDM